jgi:hypothetical protein
MVEKQKAQNIVTNSISEDILTMRIMDKVH